MRSRYPGRSWFAGLCLAWVVLVHGPLADSSHGADWTQFRGPKGIGISDETGLPQEWSDKKNIAWKAELPGHGSSSPIVLGDRVFVTCYSGYGLSEDQPGDIQQLTRSLLCLSRQDGKLMWQMDVAAELPEESFDSFQTLHGYASSTPATDGEQVFVFFGRSGVVAHDLQGKQAWRVSVGTNVHDWGSGTSPVLFKNLVIVNASVESDALVALDKKDGHEVWRAEGIQSAWNTPLLVDVAGGDPELVISSQGQVRAYNPASGEPLWTCDGIQDYVCPSVTAHEGVVFVIGGRGTPGLAVRAGGRGDVTSSHILWSMPKGSNVSSPVYHDGYFYWAQESDGIIFCADAKSGELVYQQRLKPRPGMIYASAVAADGKLYFVSREAGTFVVAAGRKFKLLAHNRIASDKSIFNGSPAVSQGQLFLRSDRFLYCIGK